MAITGRLDTVDQILSALRSNEEDRRVLEQKLAELMLKGEKV